jgi:hypothetical protein
MVLKKKDGKTIVVVSLSIGNTGGHWRFTIYTC